jgi:AcrR family transcriptional regulator
MEGSTAVRRTQAERRAETRNALLEASLECLVEEGYAGLTTRRVAERAGVSAATLRVYFPNRPAFVAAALGRFAVELRAQVTDLSLGSEPPVERFRASLDALWKICNGPIFSTFSELVVAARRDEDAREGLMAAERAVTRQIAETAAELFPEDIANPRFRLLVDLAISSMRGLAMFGPIAPKAEIDRRWRAIRDEVTESYRHEVRGS